MLNINSQIQEAMLQLPHFKLRQKQSFRKYFNIRMTLLGMNSYLLSMNCSVPTKDLGHFMTYIIRVRQI